MTAGAVFADMHDDLFDELGVDATWTPPGGSQTSVRVVYSETTPVITELGTMLDPRPSVDLLRSVVGDSPRGEVSINGQRFDLDRPVDGGDEYVTRMFLRPEGGL